MGDTKKIFIGFDGEFSGPFNPRKHYMIALGFVAVLEDGKEVGSMRVCMQPPTPEHGFDRDTLATYWNRPGMPEMLAAFQRDAISPTDAMRYVKSWIDGFVRTNLHLVCDCTTDATWLDHYLVEFAGAQPLICYGGEYTGWPLVTDDFYRGITGTLDLWGITDTMRNVYKIEDVPRATHDPVDDAREIVGVFVRVLAGRRAEIAKMSKA